VPSWEDVRYFLAVARAGSLAKAGRALKVQHTTVARRVTQLEQDLGVALIARTPDGVQLTAAGERALAHAEAVEAQMSALALAVGGDDDRVEGAVRVTVSEGVSGFLLRRLAPLKARHPLLDIHILTSNRAYDLSRGEADIAIRAVVTSDSELKIRKLADAAWCVYAAKEYLAAHEPPMNADDLKNHSLIGFDEGLANVPGAIWLRDHGLEDRVVLRTNSIPSALSAAVSAIGLALLPSVAACDEGAVVRVLDDVVIDRRPMWLVTHPDVARTARVRVVMDFLAEIVDAERDVVEAR
jgi:DNA-binding transcriptional LysR family regulator